jgi:hypothetical protein
MATKKSKKKSASNFVPYSTKDNFNPLEDYNVGQQQIWRNNDPDDSSDGRVFSRHHSDENEPTYNFNNNPYNLPSSYSPISSSEDLTKWLPKYNTYDSARIAAKHAASITDDTAGKMGGGFVPKAAFHAPANPNRPAYRWDQKTLEANAARRVQDLMDKGVYSIPQELMDRSIPTTRYTKDGNPIYTTERAALDAAPGANISNATKEGLGFVPRAEAANTPASKYTPREQQLIKDSAANVAARESGNTPAHNAAYRAQTYQKEADRKRAAGDKQSADRWAKSAAEERAKASQLGYKGDFKNLSATQKPSTPKPSTPTASSATPKPSAPSASSAKPDSVKKWDDKYVSDKIKADMKRMESSEAARDANINEGKRNSEIKDLDDQVQDFKETEQRWRDKAAKATSPEQKEHALQMAAEYSDKAKDREKKISDKKNESMSDIKPLSKSDKDKKKGDSLTDPMEDLIAGIPELNNSSAYSPTGGPGGSGGIAGFFTRDGKVIPITA